MKERKIIITERGSGEMVFISFLKPDEIAYWKTLNLIDHQMRARRQLESDNAFYKLNKENIPE